MGGDNINEDWDITLNAVSTLVLLGKSGNGKSATCNSILNRKAFQSQASISGVTSTCELQKTVMEDGREVNVIDTPGIFYSSEKDEFDYKEIMKFIDLAKEGIHAILVVFSTRGRYSEEEAATLKTLKDIFGEKITNYMIVVFTGGDELEQNDISFEKFIHDCPEFEEVLILCEQIVVLFDNRTKDVCRRALQISQLLSLVDLVVAKNNGKYKIKELEPPKGVVKPETLELLDRLNKQSNDQLKRFAETLETELRETRETLEQKLEEEKKARLKAEGAKQEWEDETRRLREGLENAERSRGRRCFFL